MPTTIVPGRGVPRESGAESRPITLSDDVDPFGRKPQPSPPGGARAPALPQPARLGALYLIYAVSGFLSLGYQVAWLRIHLDRFGATNLTFGLVIALFIGGLGLGALSSRRLVAWLCRLPGIGGAWTAYGLLELAIGLLVLASPVVLSGRLALLPGTTYSFHDGVFAPALPRLAIQSALTLAAVLLPCILMGTTYPLLCSLYRGVPRFPSALYAWNTLGAGLGVIVTQFALLSVLGHQLLLLLLAAANILLGLVVLGPARGLTARPGRFVVQAAAARQAAAPWPRSRLHLYFACAAVGGLVTGGMQGDLLERITFLCGSSTAAMSFVSFWAIAGVFAAATLVRLVPGLRLLHVKLAWAGAVLYYLVAFQFSYEIQSWLSSAWAAGSPGEAPAAFGFPASMPQLLLFVCLFVFPPAVLTGILLPWMCDRLHATSRHLGVMYGLNTLGFFVGLMAFTWFAPRVSVFYAMKLFVLLLLTAALFLASISRRGGLGVWRPLVAGIMILGAVFVTPAGFDPDYVTPGSPAALYPVRALRSNGAHTTYVVADPEGERLYFDNHSMSGTGFRAQVYMRLMAHLPLLAHPHPTRALLIGFGVGNTAAAIAAHDSIESLDVVELNREVLRTAPEFNATHGGVQRDPRLSFYVDDGRAFLRGSTAAYDLITTEPPPPRMAGVHRLYSREFYRDVLDHLTEDGYLSQWIPIYQLPDEATRKMIATFLDVFPHAALFTGYGRDLILVGGSRPVDYGRLAERFPAQEGVREDLAALGMTGPVDLLARLLQDNAMLRREYGGGALISDARNDLLDMYVTRGTRAPVRYEPAAVERAMAAAGVDLAPVLSHLGRLTYHVPDFPADSLMTIAADGGPRPVALAGLDWARVEELLYQYSDLRGTGRRREAMAVLQRGLDMSEQLPALLLDLAGLQLEEQQHAAALATLQRFLRLEPGDPRGRAARGWALVGLGRPREARTDLEAAAAALPGDPVSHYYLGLLDLADRSYRQAAAHFQRVLRSRPSHAASREGLAVARQAMESGTTG